MISYFEILQTAATQRDIDLRLAFDHAHLPSSTFYRAQKRNDMRFATACRVMNAIEKLYTLEKPSRD